MPTTWRVYGKQTVACRFDRCDLPGLFRKKIVVGPGEAAIVLRDGQVEAVLTESSVEVASVLDQVASMFKVGADIAVYLVDLSPLDISIFVGKTAKDSVTADGTIRLRATSASETAGVRGITSAVRQIGWLEESETTTAVSASTELRLDVSELSILALSSDKEVIQAECRLRLHIDPDDPAYFVATMKGKRALATWDIAALLRDELLARVLVPEIAKRSSHELTGDRALLQAIEQGVIQEMGTTLQNFGLIFDAFTILWGTTVAEQAEIIRKQSERREQVLDFAKNRQIAHLKRQQEIDKTRLANLNEYKVAKLKGDEELADLLLGGEIHRDLMVKGKLIQEAQIDASIREIQLSIEKNESMLRLEQKRANEELRLEMEDRAFQQQHDARLASLEIEDKEMRSLIKAQIDISTAKHDRDLAKRRQELDSEFRKLEADVEDRYQQRKLKLEESLARMGMIERLVSQGLNAGAADASVLTTMLQQSTEQEYATTSDEKVRARSEAQAAGQNLDTYRNAEDRDRRHQAEMTGLAANLMEAAKQPPTSAMLPATICSHCNSPVQKGWKACPHCGNPLLRTCNSCGGSLQANWKACPTCGIPAAL